MKTTIIIRGIGLPWSISLLSVLSTFSLNAQTWPFSPSNWPPTINSNAVVDYLIVDPNAVFSTPPGWMPSINFPGSGGDETWQTVTLAGSTGDHATRPFINPAHPNHSHYLHYHLP